MKKIKYIGISLVILLGGCDYLEPEALSLKEKEGVYQNLNYIKQVLTSAYTHVSGGYTNISDSWLASASDEAEDVLQSRTIQKFNTGDWTVYSNPDNVWAGRYQGIRKVCDLLEGTENQTWDGYEYSNPQEWERRNRLTEQYRYEARFLRALFYYDLIIRYGGVPLVTKKLDMEDEYLKGASRNSFEECVNFIVDECDQVAKVLPDVQEDAYLGRATKGAALALKSRILLYAASDLYNQSGNTNPLVGYTEVTPELRKERWLKAARAAKEVLNMSVYKLHDSYRNLFILGATRSTEVLWSRMYIASTTFNASHYPIGYEKGETCTCPTQNLVDAYEMTNGSCFNWSTATTDPYADRDPRLAMTVTRNNEVWAGRPVEIWTGGLDGYPRDRATKTGYYLKKWVTDNLDFSGTAKVVRQWIYFRLGEIYLNYAEAMNEAFKDPDYTDNLDGSPALDLSARDAVQKVRDRADVRMPAIEGDSETFKKRLQNERRIELSFENHRWFDVRRWMIGEESLGGEIRGVSVKKANDEEYTYTPFVVEKRVFDKNKMYFYPIPQSEINKSGETIVQNPGW